MRGRRRAGGEGRRADVWLLTDVPRGELSVTQAAHFYRLRWENELFFRSYKRALQRRRLLSRTAAACLVEARWVLLGLWPPGLMTVSRRRSRGLDPLAMSVAEARDAVRYALRDKRPRRGPRGPDAALHAASKDSDPRHGMKAARNYPRKKREEPPGPPKIQSATEAEIPEARKFPQPEIPLKWTA